MTIPSTSAFSLTGDYAVDVSTTGYRWVLGSGRVINWSISDGFLGEYWPDPAAVASHVNDALGTFSYYADVSFNFVGYFDTPIDAYLSNSDINVSLDSGAFIFSPDVWAIGNFPTSEWETVYIGQAGDVYLNINSRAYSLPSYEPGSAGWALTIHELGHALGLKHTHMDGGTGRPTLADWNLGQFDGDWVSMMSYQDDTDFTDLAFDPATPMLLDVIGLQYLYGINRSTNLGDTVFQLEELGLYLTIWDAGGTDTVSAAGAAGGWTIQLPDTVVSPLVGEKFGFAEPTGELDLPSPLTLVWLEGDIENAYGSAFADTIFGNDLANRLDGNGGDDVLWGAAGSDILRGNAGNDTLDGGTGDDQLEGGTGNDTFIVDNALDRVVELLNQGVDTVRTSVNFTLGANIENGVVIGTLARNLTGNALVNTLVGNVAANSLSGSAGNDRLFGGGGNDKLIGGLGRDIMTGGPGADVFDFNSVGEIGKGTTRDRISDFAHLIDDIDLSTIDANGSAAGNTAFKFLAAKNAAFTGVKGQLHWFQINAPGTANDKTIVEGDASGNKVADFQIELTGLKNLTAGDFIL